MHRGCSKHTFVSMAVLLMTAILGSTSGRADRSANRALILGGGGPVGEAWESGIIAGLKERGVELAGADRIIGTSAGSIVGARLASKMSDADFIKAALDPPNDGPKPPASQKPPDLSFLAARLAEMDTGKRPQQDIRAEIGAWAMSVPPVITEIEFVSGYQRLFPRSKWPDPRYEAISVDANDGLMRRWNESSGVPLPLAVAASCALPGVFAPVTIDGHYYMDGGVRSVTNADLASGCRVALILAPTAGLDDPIAKDFTHPLDGEMRTLRDNGCKVELIAPDPASLKAFGPSIGDQHHRAQPLEAGRAQGNTLAAQIARIWGK
jgi:NTE family protein